LLAAVGHDLLDQRRRRPGVVHIGAFRDGSTQAQRSEPPDDAMAVREGGALPGGRPADSALASDSLSAGPQAGGELSSPASGLADTVCRVAA
jgi:hypothetical protein